MLEGHFGKIIEVKHIIKPTSPEARTIHSAPYYTGRWSMEERQPRWNEGYSKNARSQSWPTEFSVLIVFNKRPDTPKCSGADFQKLNLITVRDFHPLKKMDKCIYSLGDTWVILVLKASSAYWQKEVIEEDRDKTGLYLELQTIWLHLNAVRTQKWRRERKIVKRTWHSTNINEWP